MIFDDILKNDTVSKFIKVLHFSWDKVSFESFLSRFLSPPRSVPTNRVHSSELKPQQTVQVMACSMAFFLKICHLSRIIIDVFHDKTNKCHQHVVFRWVDWPYDRLTSQKKVTSRRFVFFSRDTWRRCSRLPHLEGPTWSWLILGVKKAERLPQAGGMRCMNLEIVWN